MVPTPDRLALFVAAVLALLALGLSTLLSHRPEAEMAAGGERDLRRAFDSAAPPTSRRSGPVRLRRCRGCRASALRKGERIRGGEHTRAESDKVGR
jgi:hypothetical protein